MTYSAWGVDHGEVSKSLIRDPSGALKFISATKAGKSVLRSSKDSGRYYRDPNSPDKNKRQDLQMQIKNRRSALNNLSGRKTDLNKPPKKAGVEEKTIVPGYKNAHPDRWGSKKGGTTRMVVGDKAAKKKGIVEHERMHADNRSSWRLAQIEGDAAKLGREEARADTLSGTYKNQYFGNMRTHSESKRQGAGKAGQRSLKFQDKQTRSVFGDVPAADQAGTARAFKRTQDKINDASGNKYKPRAHTARTRTTRGAAKAGVAGGVGGGLYAADKHEEKKISKSAWGVEHGVSKAAGPKHKKGIAVMHPGGSQDTVKVQATGGKTLLRRRPKYTSVAYDSRADMNAPAFAGRYSPKKSMRREMDAHIASGKKKTTGKSGIKYES